METFEPDKREAGTEALFYPGFRFAAALTEMSFHTLLS